MINTNIVSVRLLSTISSVLAYIGQVEGLDKIKFICDVGLRIRPILKRANFFEVGSWQNTMSDGV